MAQDGSERSVLFVCLGNICRSPIAEAVCQTALEKQQRASEWSVDSCGTAGYHIGDTPDERGTNCLRKHSIKTNHIGRKLCREDFYRFKYIFGMDEENMSDIKRVMPKDGTAIVSLLGAHYNPGGEAIIIDDPYYGSPKDFERVFQQCTQCVTNFLKDR